VLLVKVRICMGDAPRFLTTDAHRAAIDENEPPGKERRSPPSPDDAIAESVAVFAPLPSAMVPTDTPPEYALRSRFAALMAEVREEDPAATRMATAGMDSVRSENCAVRSSMPTARFVEPGR